MNSKLTDQFARVALDLPIESLDYRIDEEMQVAVGDRVVVPLGRRKLVGIVTEIHTASDVDPRKIRKINSVLTQTRPMSEEWLRFCRFAANYYLRSDGEALIYGLPKLFREIPRIRHAMTLKKVRELKKNQEVAGKKPKTKEKPVLNAEQIAAVNKIIGKEGYNPIVLFGVTGSGKTEVYLNAMQEVLAKDPESQVLLLVPEINLTPQLETRICERLKNENVVTLHSALTDIERARNWLAVHEGRSRVLVGTRLSIFASFKKLALIVVDEEHDASYKAGDGLRFSARDLALKRAKDNKIPCVLGSATPSLETWAKVREKTIECVRLSKRAVQSASLPETVLVDIKNKSIDVFDEKVKEEISSTIARGEQVLVFINRRGYAPVITCNACGWVSKCIHCSGFTVFHKREGKLVCHHCGATYSIPKKCPTCGNQEIEAVGTGSQKIEEAIERFWPQARVIRIDRDSVKKKGEAQEAFQSVHAGKVDIIVGTQMISKGHDFQRVSLVVILNADAQLVSPNLKAEERLFETLMQVAGRAGRAELKGKVLIQTRFMNHPLYAALSKQNYEEFADRLLQSRRESVAPPYSYQVLLLAQSQSLPRALSFLSHAAQKAQTFAGDDIAVYDPVPMTLMRLMDVERAQLLIESTNRASLRNFLSRWIKSIENESGVTWLVEVDPAEV